MKETMKIVFVLVLVIVSLAGLVSAQSVEPLAYSVSPVPPEKGNLDVRGSTQVDLFTGSATYSYPITLPPGTNGLQPQGLEFLYNSHSYNSRPGILGSGMNLPENYIERDVNSTFDDVSDDSFRLVLGGSSHDLIYSSGGFHTKIESFLKIENRTGADNENDVFWLVRDKSGSSYRFGFYDFSEAVANSQDYVWRWSLDLVNDTYGNSIFYNYSEDPHAEDIGTVYLDKIGYNNDGKREIDFVYESNTRPDLREAYENGNKIVQSRRLKEVVINVDNSLVRRYSLEYDVLDQESTSLSFLTSITEYGSDNVTSLPSIELNYYNVEKGWPQEDFWEPPECFASNEGDDSGVRLIDLNRDGLIDVLQGKDGTSAECGDEQKKAYINDGNGWVEDDNWEPPVCFLYNGGGDKGIRMTDVNGDGFVDILVAQLDEGGACTGVEAYIHNGTGWEQDPSLEPPICFITNSGDDMGVRMGDVNGDGLVDIIRSQEGTLNACGDAQKDAYINTGNGWTQDDSWEPPICFLRVDGSDKGARLADVNGDGLVDILVAQDGGSAQCGSDQKEAYINNGTNWEQDDSWEPPVCFLYNGGGEKGARMLDVNADGLIDVLRSQAGVSEACGDAQKEAFVNNGTGWVEDDSWEPPFCFLSLGGDDNGARLADSSGNGIADILRAKNGTGETCGDPDRTSYPSQLSSPHLLANITTEFGGIISISYEKSTKFSHSGDGSLNQIGFNVWVVSNITEDNGISGVHNLTSVRTYNYSGGFYDYEGDEFRGFNFVEEKVDDKVTKHWFHQSDSLKGREFKTQVLNGSGDLYKETQRDWESDEQNNYFIIELVEESELAYDGESSNPRIVNTSYDYDSFGNLIYKHSKGNVEDSGDDRYELYSYLNNSDSWIVNKLQNYSLFDSDNSTKLGEALYSYDELAYGFEPTKGGLTLQEDYLDTGDNPIIEYSYDSFGNLRNQTNPDGNMTFYEYGVVDTTHTFVDRQIDAKGFVVSYDYDLGSGNLLAETDSNEVVRNFTYDFFYIDEKTILPLDNLMYPTQEYNYSFESDEGKVIVKQREESESSETLDEYKFYDGFGRLIQSKSEAVDSQQIAVDYYYDELGRIKFKSNPYYVGFSENYSDPDSGIPKTNYNYDVLDRVIEAINPDSTSKEVVYDHWNVTIVDENDNSKGYETDSYGRVVVVREQDNSTIYETLYSYDGSDNLVSVTDSKGNNLTYLYDSLGRKTSMTDPDLGIWNYTYDLLGNLVEQKDNRNEILEIRYDELNRKIKEISSQENITYVYDVDLNNTLSRIETEHFTANFTYDDRLRKVKEEKIIDGLSFITQWTYDSADRVISKRLPSGEHINYTYDEQGQLSEMDGLANLSYNSNNNLLGVVYANSLNTNYTYDLDSLRLNRIETSDEQNLSYEYDDLGNVVGIDDKSNDFNISMTYDSLNRLITTDFVGSQTHTLAFLYDSIGNMLNVTGTSNADFYYGGSLPHAPSKVVYY